MPKHSKPNTRAKLYAKEFADMLKTSLLNSTGPIPKAKGEGVTWWRVGKCVIRKKDRSVGWNDIEVYYEVSDSGSIIGEFPTLMRAENYAKRESGNV